jgi:hypothetical protein
MFFRLMFLFDVNITNSGSNVPNICALYFCNSAYSGCDWCCGGGDEEWAELQKELSDLEGVSVNSWALKLGEELDAMKGE